jgi:hypothetical protein
MNLDEGSTSALLNVLPARSLGGRAGKKRPGNRFSRELRSQPKSEYRRCTTYP